MVVRDIGEFCAVMFRNDELAQVMSVVCLVLEEFILTEWPRLNGMISRNARVLSDSKSFIDGISPVHYVTMMVH